MFLYNLQLVAATLSKWSRAATAYAPAPLCPAHFSLRSYVLPFVCPLMSGFAASKSPLALAKLLAVVFCLFEL